MHKDTLAAMNDLAVLLCEQNKLREAEPLFRDTLRRSSEALGDTHALTLSCKTNLVKVLQNLGKLREAQLLTNAAA